MRGRSFELLRSKTSALGPPCCGDLRPQDLVVGVTCRGPRAIDLGDGRFGWDVVRQSGKIKWSRLSV